MDMENTTATDTTTIHSISHLAEMLGDATTEAEAIDARDNLIDAGYLRWDHVNGRGYLVDCVDDDFFMVAFGPVRP